MAAGLPAFAASGTADAQGVRHRPAWHFTGAAGKVTIGPPTDDGGATGELAEASGVGRRGEGR
jgi:hypothetical protein